MVRMTKLAYLWPGLLPLTRYPSLWGGVSCVAFATLFNLALAGTILWPELFSATARTVTWVLVAIVWGGAAGYTAVWNRRDQRRSQVDLNCDLLPRAMEQYLKGNWFETEHLLGRILRKNPRDVDAALMLATLWRRTERYEEAQRLLDRLSRLEAAAKWQLEIEREKRLLGELAQATAQQEQDNRAGEGENEVEDGREPATLQAETPSQAAA